MAAMIDDILQWATDENSYLFDRFVSQICRQLPWQDEDGPSVSYLKREELNVAIGRSQLQIVEGCLLLTKVECISDRMAMCVLAWKILQGSIGSLLDPSRGGISWCGGILEKNSASPVTYSWSLGSIRHEFLHEPEIQRQALLLSSVDTCRLLKLHPVCEWN
jgi:hypothetical protein